MEALKENSSVNRLGVKSPGSGALPSARVRLERTATAATHWVQILIPVLRSSRCFCKAC